MITCMLTLFLLVLAYRLGVTVERKHWRYGEHFIENQMAYRLVKDKDGNRRREAL